MASECLRVNGARAEVPERSRPGTAFSRKGPHGPYQQFDGAFDRSVPRDDMSEEGAGQNDAEEQVEEIIGVHGWIDASVLATSRTASAAVGESTEGG